MCEPATRFPGAVDGETGDLIDAPDMQEVASRLMEAFAPTPTPTSGKNKRGVIDGVDPRKLASAGWGILFAGSDGETEGILEALKDLIEHRKDLAGTLCRQFLGAAGYKAGETALDFLGRHGAGPGKVDPKKVPYYLLLVGNPEQIPYSFQYGLDHQHAVGRIWFGKEHGKDEYEGYRRYSAAVVAAEKVAERSPRVAFFGPLNDKITQLSNEALLTPLIESLKTKPSYKVRTLLGEDATKEALFGLLNGEERPNFLFTAGHGVFYKAGHPRQQTHQGALVCQGWCAGTPVESQHVFAAEDVNGASLSGLLAFLFACNSAGTPDLDDFASEHREPRQASPRPFVSNLARRFLEQGALAVVGHVERIWRCSFLWRDTGAQPQPFVETLQRLLKGDPLGWAMEPLGDRFAHLSSCLCELLEQSYMGLPVDGQAIAELWTASRDARNYVIVGDPAVRLPARVMRGG